MLWRPARRGVQWAGGAGPGIPHRPVAKGLIKHDNGARDRISQATEPSVPATGRGAYSTSRARIAQGGTPPLASLSVSRVRSGQTPPCGAR